MRFFQVIVLIVSIHIFGQYAVHGASDFLANYDISYAVSPSGKTIVTENITLVNKTSGIYPRQYAITFDSNDIRNIIAYDPKGVVPVDIKNTDGKTTLLLTFNAKVVGLDKTLPFSLRFETDAVAKKVGSIWEISIPGVPKDESIGLYDVRVSVPDSFGQNAYMTPIPLSGMHWNKELLSHGGISAAYGESQSFNLSLSYHLVNPSNADKGMSITLPPDTAYQQVLISSLSPEAQKVERDQDGNWHARYTLKPYEKIDIAAKIFVSVYPYPRSSYGKESIDQSGYLSERPYWEVSDPLIVSLAQKYKTPEDIYTYVSTSLTYDYSRISLGNDRSGAVGSLGINQSSLCNEFTDLFIAIARASGIPARRVVGYGYTTNPKIRPLSLIVDVLHTWPEYFDEKRSMWISIDPTWANTTGGIDYFNKLDFSHIAFAINGLSSSDPKSAGMYKDSAIQSKDVIVTFSEEKPESVQTSSLVLSFHLPREAVGGTQIRGYLDVRNSSGVSSKIDGIKIESLSHLVSVSHGVTDIPPFGNLTIPVAYTVPLSPRVSKDILTARAGTNSTEVEILYISMTLILLSIFTILVLGVLLIVFYKIRQSK